jgi:hypothetical protein
MNTKSAATTVRDISLWHRRADWIVLALIVAVAVISQWPVLTGRDTYCFRDIGTTHRPAWAVATQFGDGRWNPYSSFGQPFRDNPNLLLRYPAVQAPWALGWHLLVHFITALVGMRMFLRRLGCSAEGAAFGMISFGLSGYVLSSASFLNAFTAFAWAPWLLYGAIHTRESERPWGWTAIVTAASTLLLLAGEPVLAATAMLIAVALVPPAGWRALLVLGGLAASFLLTYPVWRGVVGMARESGRVVLGYDFEQATSASLHPMRLLETIVPFLFGRPDRIVEGAWWGFQVSRNQFPYVYSIALGVIPLALVMVMTRLDRRRCLWVALAAGSLLVAAGGYLPGARALHAVAPHVFRYPIRFLWVTALAVAVLAAFAVDDLVRGHGARRGAVRMLMAGAVLAFLGAMVAQADPSNVEALLVRGWWNWSWRSSPHDVLAPLIAAFPRRLCLVAACLAATSYAVSKRRGRFAFAMLAVLTILELGSAAAPLLPRVPSTVYDQPSAFVKLAAGEGLVFERAGKDIDAVRRGQYGSYPADDLRWMIAAQADQAWALSGAPHGVRYAYDRDVDGSFTWRNVLVERALDARPWPVRLRWLRANGVGAIIAYRLPAAGVTAVARTAGPGVANTLYRIDRPLEQVRRVSSAAGVATAAEAIERFEWDGFDFEKSIVVEGGADMNAIDPMSRVSGVELSAGSMECRTFGRFPGYVFVARSFSSATRATVNGKVARVYPANGHLIAVSVPPGVQLVRVEF